MTGIMLAILITLAVGMLVLILAVWFRVRTIRDSAEATRELTTVFDRFEPLIRGEFSTSRKNTDDATRQHREEMAKAAKATRDESAQSFKLFSETLFKRASEASKAQNERLDGFTQRLSKLIEASEKRGEALRATVEKRLDKIREENGQKLDEMRKVVDEKLQETLDKRLGESFKQVSERLELVHKGLGEMKSLADGVGDLKRVMTNVKTRGTWGEIQLGALLEEVLSPAQYEENVATKPSSGERVEFAIKLPGRSDSNESPVFLPLDAKFPVEDYQRLVIAQEAADPDAVKTASQQLENAIKSCAKTISEKYISPPHTTDFAILFLPTEGLFAEVLRRTGLVEYCQRNHRVSIAGPTTLAALLNSLQMGFRTLAIQQRSSEVWEVLGAVKTEFGKFGDMLQKVKKKLQEASNTVDSAETRARVMTRKLKSVEALPTDPAIALLGLSDEKSEDLVDEVNGPDGVQSSIERT